MGWCFDDAVERAVRVLKNGEAVAFPTDTVYGVGLAVRYAESPARLFELKRRDEGKPVAWLVSSSDDLSRFGKDVPPVAFELAREFWPGPLTLIVRAGDLVPRSFSSDAGTIGLRMPDSACARALARLCGSPLATTSANFSGMPSPRSFKDVDPAFSKQLECVISCEEPHSGLASTVLDCTVDPPRIVREGAVGRAQVDAAARRVELGTRT